LSVRLKNKDGDLDDVVRLWAQVWQLGSLYARLVIEYQQENK